MREEKIEFLKRVIKMSIVIDMRVESYDVQPNGSIKMSSLLKMFQKAAGDDVNRTDLNYFNLADHNIAFVLTKMSVKILSDIKVYDELSIVSHPRKTHGASFPRDFIVKRDNDIVAVARSMWVLLDLEKRSILRPSAIDSIGTLPTNDVDDVFEISDVRRNVDASRLLRTNVRWVEYSQLDMNNHLNNTFYSDFAFNLIDNCRESDAGLYMQINYKAEARLGDELSIQFVNNDDGSYDFLADNLTNEKNCFSAYISFGID